ncbi:hypothetical protein BOX15_Mlig015530g2 [Macrostomum lignano]|uniref:Fibrinogen C-terminal domain-containing protein n=1 Tax=Macrostomum lignano TaxID=282301 RepID=A0A267GZE9_9PLAT|nr:hypothetical protein BOX15_Mlig015530g2 [Macrostomum lignano]
MHRSNPSEENLSLRLVQHTREPHRMLPKAALALLICSAALVVAETATSCSHLDDDSLTNPRTVMAHGCQLTLWQAASDSSRLWAEPAFCVPAAVQPSRSDFYSDAASVDVLEDPVGGYSYVNVPVMLANRTLLDEAVRQLTARSGSGPVVSADYLELAGGVAVSSHQPAQFVARDFVWSQSDQTVGLLKLSCDGIGCSLLVQIIRAAGDSKAAEALEPVSVEAELLHPCSRRLLKSDAISQGQGRPIALQHSSYRPVRGLPLSAGQLAPCLNVTALPTFETPIGGGNCSLRLHQSEVNGTNAFYLEPLLCYLGEALIRRDFNRQLNYLQLQVQLHSDEALSAAIAWLTKNGMSDGEPAVAFMRLLDPRLSVRQWPSDSDSFGRPQVLIAADESALLLRIACGSYRNCSRLRSAVQADPLVLFSRIAWRPKFDAKICRLEVAKRRLSLPLTRPPPASPAASEPPSPTCGESNAIGACQIERLEDGRSFLLVQKRSSPGVNFSRDWSDYEQGFGNTRNFWIGLRSISAFTHPTGSLLRIEARLWNGTLLYAEYSGLRLLGPSYNLTYDAYMRQQSNTDDLLARSRGLPFSTRDKMSQEFRMRLYSGRSHGRRYNYQRRTMQSLGFAGWWWYSEATAGSVDFNPNGVFHYSDFGDPRRQAMMQSLMGLNRTLASDCTNKAKAKSWTLLKEVRLLIEI